MNNVESLIMDILKEFHSQVKSAQFYPSPNVMPQGQAMPPGAEGISPDVLAAMAAQGMGGQMPAMAPAEAAPMPEQGQEAALPPEITDAIKSAVKEALQEGKGGKGASDDRISQLEQRVANIETMLEQLLSVLTGAGAAQNESNSV